MPSTAPNTTRRSRAALLWALACFAGCQVLLLWCMSSCRPEWRDPEYGLKLQKLRRRLAERAEQQPQVLLLGSSRVAVGFRPDALPLAQTTAEHTPVVFNYSLCLSGPLLELICLRRLLADGVRPRMILLEVWPPLLTLESVEENKDTSLNILRMRWQDVRLLDHYASPSWSRYRQWAQAQLAPCSFFRYPLLNRLAPSWLERADRRDINWRGQDDWGWLYVPDYARQSDAETYRVVLQTAHNLSHGVLANLEVREPARQALREILELGHRQHVDISLVLMPESGPFRSWYSSASLARVNELLQQLQTEFGCPVIDARGWAADSDFADGVHLIHDGAGRFSQRLGQLVILPYLHKHTIAGEQLTQAD
jgi:hypothetical protein